MNQPLSKQHQNDCEHAAKNDTASRGNHELSQIDLVRNEVQEKLINGVFNCPKEFTLSMFSGKWKINIIYHLGKEGAYYFSEIERLLPAASHKELSEKLKELAADGLVKRTEVKDRSASKKRRNYAGKK